MSDISSLFELLISTGVDSVTSNLLKVPLKSLEDIWYYMVGWRTAALREFKSQEKENLIHHLQLGNYSFFQSIVESLTYKDPKNIQNPSTNLVESYFQFVLPCLSEEELRNTYAKLIANTMDQSKNDVMHPSFGCILSQMSSLDAKIFKNIQTSENFVLTLWKNKHEIFYAPANPDTFGKTIEDLNISIQNLQRMQIISIADLSSIAGTLPESRFYEYSSNSEIQTYIAALIESARFVPERITLQQMRLTSFGSNLFEACT